MDLNNFYLAAKYLQKTFSAFDDKFSIQVDAPSAFEHLCEGLDKLSDHEVNECEKPKDESSEEEDA